MKAATHPISEADLHAYADGQLHGARLAQVEAWLAQHPGYQAQIADWRSQNRLLHQHFDPLLQQAVPQRIIPDAPRRWQWPAMAMPVLAALSCVMLGALLGYQLHPSAGIAAPASMASAALPRLAAVAHTVYTPEKKHPVEVGADQHQHLVAWLSKRLGAELQIPQLDSAGYQLVGGRLLPGERAGVAQFMYENAAANRLTLYIQTAASQAAQPAFQYSYEQQVDVFYWVDGRFGYALSGTTGRDNMLQLARLIHTQLTTAAATERQSAVPPAPAADVHHR